MSWYSWISPEEYDCRGLNTLHKEARDRFESGCNQHAKGHNVIHDVEHDMKFNSNGFKLTKTESELVSDSIKDSGKIVNFLRTAKNPKSKIASGDTLCDLKGKLNTCNKATFQKYVHEDDRANLPKFVKENESTGALSVIDSRSKKKIQEDVITLANTIDSSSTTNSKSNYPEVQTYPDDPDATHWNESQFIRIINTKISALLVFTIFLTIGMPADAKGKQLYEMWNNLMKPVEDAITDGVDGSTYDSFKMELGKYQHVTPTNRGIAGPNWGTADSHKDLFHFIIAVNIMRLFKIKYKYDKQLVLTASFFSKDELVKINSGTPDDDEWIKSKQREFKPGNNPGDSENDVYFNNPILSKLIDGAGVMDVAGYKKEAEFPFSQTDACQLFKTCSWASGKARSANKTSQKLTFIGNVMKQIIFNYCEQLGITSIEDQNTIAAYIGIMFKFTTGDTAFILFILYDEVFNAKRDGDKYYVFLRTLDSLLVKRALMFEIDVLAEATKFIKINFGNPAIDATLNDYDLYYFIEHAKEGRKKSDYIKSIDKSVRELLTTDSKSKFSFNNFKQDESSINQISFELPISSSDLQEELRNYLKLTLSDSEPVQGGGAWEGEGGVNVGQIRTFSAYIDAIAKETSQILVCKKNGGKVECGEEWITAKGNLSKTLYENIIYLAGKTEEDFDNFKKTFEKAIKAMKNEEVWKDSDITLKKLLTGIKKYFNNKALTDEEEQLLTAIDNILDRGSGKSPVSSPVPSPVPSKVSSKVSSKGNGQDQGQGKAPIPDPSQDEDEDEDEEDEYMSKDLIEHEKNLIKKIGKIKQIINLYSTIETFKTEKSYNKLKETLLPTQDSLEQLMADRDELSKAIGYSIICFVALYHPVFYKSHKSKKLADGKFSLPIIRSSSKMCELFDPIKGNRGDTFVQNQPNKAKYEILKEFLEPIKAYLILEKEVTNMLEMLEKEAGFDKTKELFKKYSKAFSSFKGVAINESEWNAFTGGTFVSAKFFDDAQKKELLLATVPENTKHEDILKRIMEMIKDRVLKADSGYIIYTEIESQMTELLYLLSDSLSDSSSMGGGGAWEGEGGMALNDTKFGRYVTEILGDKMDDLNNACRASNKDCIAWNNGRGNFMQALNNQIKNLKLTSKEKKENFDLIRDKVEGKDVEFITLLNGIKTVYSKPDYVEGEVERNGKHFSDTKRIQDEKALLDAIDTILAELDPDKILSDPAPDPCSESSSSTERGVRNFVALSSENFTCPHSSPPLFTFNDTAIKTARNQLGFNKNEMEKNPVYGNDNTQLIYSFLFEKIDEILLKLLPDDHSKFQEEDFGAILDLIYKLDSEPFKFSNLFVSPFELHKCIHYMRNIFKFLLGSSCEGRGEGDPEDTEILNYLFINSYILPNIRHLGLDVLTDKGFNTKLYLKIITMYFDGMIKFLNDLRYMFTTTKLKEKIKTYIKTQLGGRVEGIDVSNKSALVTNKLPNLEILYKIFYPQEGISEQARLVAMSLEDREAELDKQDKIRSDEKRESIKVFQRKQELLEDIDFGDILSKSLAKAKAKSINRREMSTEWQQQEEEDKNEEAKLITDSKDKVLELKNFIKEKCPLSLRSRKEETFCELTLTEFNKKVHPPPDAARGVSSDLALEKHPRIQNDSLKYATLQSYWFDLLINSEFIYQNPVRDLEGKYSKLETVLAYVFQDYEYKYDPPVDAKTDLDRAKKIMDFLKEIKGGGQLRTSSAGGSNHTKRRGRKRKKRTKNNKKNKGKRTRGKKSKKPKRTRRRF